MVDQNKALDVEIKKLQSLKREGDYWDFKREWHNDKGDLLHDIICMANNLSGHNGYIIIGIDDENDCKVIDVSNDPNRKNTQNIIDFLSTKPFAGDIRPFAYVETIRLDEKSVDVLVVVSDSRVPYYLTERCEKVNPNNIYIRVGDTNTPINKSADVGRIEKLWQWRFGLDLSPIDRVFIYLSNPFDWVGLHSGDGYYYNKFPEFRIQFEDDPTRTSYEYYMFPYVNTESRWFITRIYYHQTPLNEILCNSLGGERLLVSAPDWLYLDLTSRSGFLYHSYTKNSLKWMLNKLFNTNQDQADLDLDSLYSIVPVFENEYERSDFEKYVAGKYDAQELEKYSNRIDSIRNIDNDDYKERLEKDFENALYLIDMLNEYRRAK